MGLSLCRRHDGGTEEMTITTEEAERLAVACGLPVIAAALRSLAAERDALQARVTELEGALQRLLSMNDDRGLFGGEINLGRIDRAWDKARAALEGEKP